MKYVKTFSAVCGVLLTLAATASAETFKPGGATIVRIQGEARYSIDSGKTWIPLVVGKIVEAGAVLQTGHDSYLDVVLGKIVAMPQSSGWPSRISQAPDAPVRGMVSYTPSVEQNTVRLSSDTTLQIDKLTVSETGLDTVSDTELDLQKGHIFASVKKLTGASQYLVKIPNGIAGVRGTVFGLGSDGSCEVLKSSVLLSVIGANGVPITTLVKAGDSFNPANGQTQPLDHGVLIFLQNLLPALTSTYAGQVNYTFDVTTCHVSATSGNAGGQNGFVLQVVP